MLVAARLFSPLTLRELQLKNRIAVSPMCQYAATDGVPGPWHAVHLGSRAVGGAGLVMAEATAVSPTARISLRDTGLWNDAQVEAFRSINDFVKDQGAAPGIQLAHAGRKGSSGVPWVSREAVAPADGGWRTRSSSAIPFSDALPAPAEMTRDDIATVVGDFGAAARRCEQAGFEVIELHFAHGYLLHQFLSPLVNRRDDAYGGSLAKRCAFALEVVRAVRGEWPAHRPLFVRLSCTDWVDGGWDLEQTVTLAQWLRDAGVDLIDCSSGAIVPGAQPAHVGLQTPLAAQVRRRAGIATAAVGGITEPRQAQAIVETETADLVMMARALLADPYWPLRAAQALDDGAGAGAGWPAPYARGVKSVQGKRA